jgi:hypothetical protein
MYRFCATALPLLLKLLLRGTIALACKLRCAQAG